MSQLKTQEEKQNYLEAILSNLQELEFEHEQLRYLDVENDAYQSYLRRKAVIQTENTHKISAYFEYYGYPSRPQLGQYAALAPYAVIFYSENLEEAIKPDEFRFFYGAYKYGDIPPDMFLSYLLDYYKVTKGEAIAKNPDESTKYNIEYIFGLLEIEQ